MPLTWNTQKTSKTLQISNDDRQISSHSKHPMPKSSLSLTPFVRGARYFFELKLNKGHSLKVGVARKETNPESSFSATPLGWSFACSGLKFHNNG